MPWYLPLVIFAMRVCDVSMGTLRTILIVSGYRWQPAALGFCEVTIWTLAISGVIKYLSSPLALIGYAGGYAAGVYVGITIERRIAIGFRMVRVISSDLERRVSLMLRDRGFAVTRIDGEGREGPVEIAFLVVRRRMLDHLLAHVRDLDPDAFVTIERADRASGGVFTVGSDGRGSWALGALRK